MQKIFFILITLHITLFAFTSIKKLKYESGISIYGQIGYVELSYEENHDTHTYKMVAKTTSIGLVKLLSGNRIDIFTSEGSVQDGLYVPRIFTRYTSKNDSNKTRVYLFDSENKIVQKTQTTSTLEVDLIYDSLSFDFEEEEDEEQIVVQIQKEEITFETNDFLTLYLNLIQGNLLHGKVPYIDMKKEDSLIYKGKNIFEIHKNHGEDKYSIIMVPDEASMFFQEVKSVGISFYGDAYIKKTSEETRTIY